MSSRTTAACVFAALLTLAPASRGQSAGAVGPPPESTQIAEVVVVFERSPADDGRRLELEAQARKAFQQFPRMMARQSELEFGLSRVRGVPGLAGASYRLEPLSGGGVRVVLVLEAGPGPGKRDAHGTLATGDLGELPLLYADAKHYAKLTLGGTFAGTLAGNTWFGAGRTFTRNNPYGQDPPTAKLAPQADFVLTVGLAAARRVVPGLWLYGELQDMTVASVGDELYRSDPRIRNHIERAYAGLVGGGISSSGHVWGVNLSAGLQGYCIGNGMLLCQIAGNGGDWGGANAWPRFSGELVALGQFRYDNLRVDGFYVDPNEYTGASTGTKLAGGNVDYDRGTGLSLGATYLYALEGSFPYVSPNGELHTRQGLHAMSARAGYRPQPRESGPLAKAEAGLQAHSVFDMLAYAIAVEGGWSFGSAPWAPALTYRYSTLSGDDPSTAQFERWDLLYSGGDVDSWVHGILFKNVLFNANLQAHRFQVRLSPSPRWRLTGQALTYVANQLNNLPLSVPQYASHQLGQELLAMVEYFVGRSLYVRAIGSALFPGSGLRGAIAEPLAFPWYSAQMIVKVTF